MSAFTDKLGWRIDPRCNLAGRQEQQISMYAAQKKKKKKLNSGYNGAGGDTYTCNSIKLTKCLVAVDVNILNVKSITLHAHL